MEGVFLTPALPFDLTLLLRAEVGQYLQSGTPPLKLHLPVDDDGRWNHDQVWTPDSTVARQRRNQGNRLNGLAETHLVCKDSVEPLVMKCDQPIKPNDLVLSQFASQ